MNLDLANILGLPELPTYLRQVEQELAKAANSDNPHIAEPTARLVQARGKRLRPSLVIAAATSQGKKVDDKVVWASAAIELIHIASLVHDDIIDEAATRWNIPTINDQEGIGQAIVAGDYLLAKACQQAASISSGAGQLAAETIAKLCDGQAQELADQYNTSRTRSSYFQAIAGKTAALFSAAGRIGGLVAGLSQADVEALSQFGQHFGMAFQLIDDLLDFSSSEELLGKPTGTDIREGVYTLPLLLALESPGSRVYKRLIRENSQAQLANKLARDGFIRQTTYEIKEYNRRAAQALDIFANPQTAVRLKNFPAAYLDWALQNLVTEEYKVLVSFANQ